MFQWLANEYSYSNIHGIEMKKPIRYAKKHKAILHVDTGD
jgi:hypothetical protein